MADRKIELPEGIPALNTYYAYLTGGCNLACQHCYLAPTYQANGGTGGHLDYDLFVLAIEEGLPLGLNNVKLTGGEPLLHPDFIRIVDLIRENKLGLTIETNGTLVTESIAHYLKEKSTLGHISVSLDGATADTHDPFRGVKGSFDKAVQGIRYLVEAGFYPQMIMSLHAGNVDEIEALVLLAESIGAGSIKFNLIQPSGRGEVMTKKNRTLDIQRLIELGKWVERDLQKRTSISLHYSWPMAFYSLDRLLSNDPASCGIFGILGILSTGHLAMCGIGMQVKDLCYGLLGCDPVTNVWVSHPLLLKMRKVFPAELEGVCQSCILHDRCMASCVASNYQHSQSLTSSFWFCHAAVEAGLFPTSRLKCT
jgi:SynChlorMet cassette radical SAM/SPASM protein ScmF